MKSVNELKQSAVPRLMCCWGESIAVFFITMGCISAFVIAWMIAVDFAATSGVVEISDKKIDLSNGIILAITAAMFFLLWIALTPFSYGVKWYRMQQIRGNSVHARSIFSCYTSIRRAGQVFRLSFELLFRRLYILVPFIAVLISGLLLISYIAGKGEITLGYAAVVVLLLLLAGIMYCAYSVINIKYALVPYLFALEPDKSPKELIEKSRRLVKGKYGYMAEVLSSLTSYFIPCILIFPAVFIMPYVKMVYTAAMNELIEVDGKDDFDLDSMDLMNKERGEKIAVGK